MPRQTRKKSESGIYHIMIRGINCQLIFEDEEDSQTFLETLRLYKEELNCKIYAYCLMKNHVHLLLKISNEKVETFMRKLGAKYVYWYNRKYNRVGGLFQDRYKSESVEDDKYFLSVLKYIHQNPIKAGICKATADYNESSFNEYITPKKGQLTDTEFVSEIMNRNQFIEFCDEISKVSCMDIVTTNHVNDNRAKQIIYKVSNCNNVSEFQNLEIMQRNNFVKKLIGNGLSIRQIARLTGINRGIIQRINSVKPPSP